MADSTRLPAGRSRLSAHRSLAIHEAGHAVVGYFLDVPPRRIVIGDGRKEVKEGVLGYVQDNFRMSRQFLNRIEFGRLEGKDLYLVSRLVASMCAGVVAEQMARGGGRLWNAGGMIDRRNALDLCGQIHAGHDHLAATFFSYGEALGRQECEKRWPYVVAVADVLQEKGSLDGRTGFPAVLAGVTASLMVDTERG